MAFRLSEKLKRMTPYEPISGVYEVRLDANESFLPPSPAILEELKQELETVAFNRYPDPMATSVCQKFAGYYGISPENVTAGNGSDELISVIATAFLKQGDKLLTVAPDFSMYGFYAELSGVEHISLQKDADLNIDIDQLIETAKRERVSCVMFSNPCNPTGQGVKREQVRKLLNALDCLVVLDEAYMDFYTESLLDEVDQYENLIILRTCSKALGLAAIRLGFAVANPTLTKILRAVKSPYNVNSVTQAYGSVMLSHKEEERVALAEILSAREELYQEVVKLQEETGYFARVYPTVTNFVLVETPRAGEIFEKLKSRSVVVRLMGNRLRMTAGSKEENRRLIQALREIIKEG